MSFILDVFSPFLSICSSLHNLYYGACLVCGAYSFTVDFVLEDNVITPQAF